MIDLGDLTVLLEAVRQGSISAAGRQLGLTPVAASRRLAALEAELGVRLLHRTTRSLSLTTEGEAFLPHAEAIVEHANDGRAAATADEANVSGILRITASIPFGRKVVTPMLACFLRAHPRLRVELRLDDTFVDIVAEGIDVALRIGELQKNDLVARRLSDSPRGLYAAPGYLARHGTPSTLAELRQHNCLTFPGVTHWTFDHDGRSVRQPVRGRFAADSMEALHQASLEGLGIVQIAEWNVCDDVSAGRLVPVLLEGTTVPDPGIWAVIPTRRFLPAKVRLFLDAFAAHLKSMANFGGPAQNP